MEQEDLDLATELFGDELIMAVSDDAEVYEEKEEEVE